MSLTALDLPAEALRKYHPQEALRRRKAKMRAELSERRRLANLTCRKAAKLLRGHFGAKEVTLFGSLARRGGFTLFSDIDLAVRGLPSERFFEAVGAVTGLSAEFRIDLIELETCPPALLRKIEEYGKAL